MVKTLASDTVAPAFPQVIDALARVNHGEAASYGADEYTRRAQDRFRDLFGAPVEVRWSLGGTGANIFSMAALVQRHQAILCADTAHMVLHECGAVPQSTGAQFRTIASGDAKLRPEDVRPYLQDLQDDHVSRPRVLSITQTTELGAVYTADEIAALAELAHGHDLYLHVDGARIATALAAADADPKTALTDVGVDVISFGGTKAGTAFGEAVVFIDPSLAQDVKRTHISTGQLSAKTRFIAAQFEAFLTDDLWLRGARQANQMAQLLSKRLGGIPGVELQPVEANIIWANVSSEVTARVRDMVHTTNGRARWVTAWDTSEADVDAVAEVVAGTASR
ncbi:MAG TPA: aminotransferase class V-fold PLP-dependent enzyme [Mycobacteriales bacterium]|jgi:threonine aldolase|nr:aminotransferase class V-fold PLP-dependent enzyme [Mycobacteriales bacterium]